MKLLLSSLLFACLVLLSTANTLRAKRGSYGPPPMAMGGGYGNSGYGQSGYAQQGGYGASGFNGGGFGNGGGDFNGGFNNGGFSSPLGGGGGFGPQ